MHSVNFTLLFSICLGLGSCANILVVPLVSQSHFRLFEHIFNALVDKGHNLTVISFYKTKEPISNYRDINLSTGDGFEYVSLALDSSKKSRPKLWRSILVCPYFAEKFCEKILQNRNLHSFLKENNTYDLVMVEMFYANCILGIVKKFQAPVVGKLMFRNWKTYKNRKETGILCYWNWNLWFSVKTKI